MNLTNLSNPVLLVSPSYDSDRLTQAAIELTDELTDIVKHIDFAEASSKRIQQTIGVCKRGIERVMKLEGSTNIISTDNVKAEQILNYSLEVFSQQLNSAMLELKQRSLQDSTDLYTYMSELSAMIDTSLSWSEGKRSPEPEPPQYTPLTQDEMKYL